MLVFIKLGQVNNPLLFRCSRKNPFGLIVALGEEPAHEATGKLIWDDGETDSKCANVQSSRSVTNVTSHGERVLWDMGVSLF